MNVLAVNFRSGKLVRRVKDKSDLTKHRKTQEKTLVSFMKKMKDDLTQKQYILVLEAMACHSFAKKLCPQATELLEEYYSILVI